MQKSKRNFSDLNYNSLLIINYSCPSFTDSCHLFYPSHTTQNLGSIDWRLVLGLLNMLADILAYYNGWWYYSLSTTPYGPLGYYIITSIFYGA